MIHDLKILTEHMEAIDAGRKTFEVRIGDREYKEGDWLRLHEWNPNGGYLSHYTGCGLRAEVKMVHIGLGMQDGYVVMALGAVERIGKWESDPWVNIPASEGNDWVLFLDGSCKYRPVEFEGKAWTLRSAAEILRAHKQSQEIAEQALAREHLAHTRVNELANEARCLRIRAEKAEARVRELEERVRWFEEWRIKATTIVDCDTSAAVAGFRVLADALESLGKGAA